MLGWVALFWDEGWVSSVPVNVTLLFAGMALSIVNNIPFAQDGGTFTTALTELQRMVNSPSQNEQNITLLNIWVKSNPNYVGNAFAATITAAADTAILSQQNGWLFR